MLYLGIDQNKRQLTVNLRDEDGDVILKRQVSTQPEKVRALFAGLAEKAALRVEVGRTVRPRRDGSPSRLMACHSKANNVRWFGRAPRKTARLHRSALGP